MDTDSPDHPEQQRNGHSERISERKRTALDVSIHETSGSEMKIPSYIDRLNLSPSLSITVSSAPQSQVDPVDTDEEPEKSHLDNIDEEIPQPQPQQEMEVQSHQSTENTKGNHGMKKVMDTKNDDGLDGGKNEINKEQNVLPVDSGPTTTEVEEERPRKKRRTLEEAKKRIQESEKMLHSEDDSEEDEDGEKWRPSPPKKKGRKSSTVVVDEGGVAATIASIKRQYAKRKHNIFNRPNISILKKTMQSYLQDGFCTDMVRGIVKCLECRYIMYQSTKKQNSIFCRFFAFRKLKYSKYGVLMAAGFSDPKTDPKEEDLSLWLPSKKSAPPMMDPEMAKFLLSRVGDQFCELIHQEKEVANYNCSENDNLAWKRLVQGIREMCDVCETTLFNFHFACGKCGFGVCLSCYKGRLNGIVKASSKSSKNRDEFDWLHCVTRQSHQIEKLMLTQAIAGDSLEQMADLLHKVRAEHRIPQTCGCEYIKKYEAIVGTLEDHKMNSKGLPTSVYSSPGSMKPSENQMKSTPKKKQRARKDSSSEEEEDEDAAITRIALGPKPSKPTFAAMNANSVDSAEIHVTKGVNAIGSTMPNFNINSQSSNKPSEELKHFVRIPSSLSSHNDRYGKLLPINSNSLQMTAQLYPSVPHTWLCGGKLLRLHAPANPDNYQPFQEVWKRGQPVLVSNVSDMLTKYLWSPESFSQDFGEQKNDLINCISGKIVPQQPLKTFWDGFENVSKRLKDEKGEPMLLKLKDWPAGDDFADMLPSRFMDLMNTLPLTEYTHRTGNLNLAARLPENFVKPDLGPKMYIAYGSGLFLDKGTTNLHLDISDAVNLLVHASVPLDCDNTEHNAAVLAAIKDSDMDILTTARVTERGELPGALWHIYNAKDADKIRDLLNKVSLENGRKLERHNDPIHDQSYYLDGKLRARLMAEYNVIGYPILQCLGDAVFIPAGAPHQVRNLQNCIKIAEDFVSPENVSHCFHLTEEFRNLSDTHINREDKLQIKNIIYHTVKDCLSVLAIDLPDIKPVQIQNESGSTSQTNDSRNSKSTPRKQSGRPNKKSNGSEGSKTDTADVKRRKNKSGETSEFPLQD